MGPADGGASCLTLITSRTRRERDRVKRSQEFIPNKPGV